MSIETAYIGVASQSVKLLGREASSKAAKRLKDGLRLSSNGLDGRLDADLARGLDLDDVLALDEIDITRNVQRGTLVRSGQGQGENSKEGGRTHLD
jgi:hypothetical protein